MTICLNFNILTERNEINCINIEEVVSLGSS